MDLPFLVTDYQLLGDIFNTLEHQFGLIKNSNQKFIDLGAGNGDIVIFSAINYGIQSHGIEIDPTLIQEANQRILALKHEGNFKNKLLKKITIKLGDFYWHNLRRYDFIYIYSLPTMQKYLKHVFSTAKKGAIIISHKYKFDIFSSFLKNKSKLAHKEDKQEIFTFFYKKIL